MEVNFPSRAAFREWVQCSIDEATEQIQRMERTNAASEQRDKPPLDPALLIRHRDCFRQIAELLDTGRDSPKFWKRIKTLLNRGQKLFWKAAREWRAYAMQHGWDKIPGVQLPPEQQTDA